MFSHLPPPQALLFSGKFLGRRYDAGKVYSNNLGEKASPALCPHYKLARTTQKAPA